jgi:CheY-like chemotaxis protein
MARKQILVIEDDADIRECLMLMLESEGYRVAGAADGREGLDVLAGMSGPCLILLDLMMPVMNGWEFLQAKRKDDILAVIPVVVLSAFGSDGRGEQVEGILKKPVDVDALLAFVRKHCGSSGL